MTENFGTTNGEQARRLWASSEFDEFATCDMPTADSAWHYWLQKKYNQRQRKRFIDAKTNNFLVNHGKPVPRTLLQKLRFRFLQIFRH